MPDMKLTENVKAKGKLKISVLKLNRETLRELDAGELKQAQGGKKNPPNPPSHTCYCDSERRCTHLC